MDFIICKVFQRNGRSGEWIISSSDQQQTCSALSLSLPLSLCLYCLSLCIYIKILNDNKTSMEFDRLGSSNT